LDRVGLEGFLRSYPHELSGGMQQRVALVRAFALDAPVLLMDEPFAALDEITRAEMRYLLLELAEERQATVVFVTHSIAEAVMLSDRVVVMTGRPGRIEADREIPLPRPRHPEQEETAEFFALETELRRALRTGRQP
jgi:NitT/TauT family transport system ATP-binding protein